MRATSDPTPSDTLAIVFKVRGQSAAQLDQYFVQETKRIREHQDRVIAERLNGA
jgi:hypothetical protein